MDIRDYLKEELERERALFDAYKKMLPNLPEGRLETVTSKSSPIYRVLILQDLMTGTSAIIRKAEAIPSSLGIRL